MKPENSVFGYPWDSWITESGACTCAGCMLCELPELGAKLQVRVATKMVRQKKSWVDSGSGSLPSE